MNKRFVTLVLLGSLLGGCVSVPKESAQLSADLGTMIRDARESHLALIDEYMRERRTRMDEFIEQKWIPTYMKKFLKESKFAEQYDTEKNPSEKAAIVEEFQQQASKDIAQQRAAMANGLADVEKLLRKRIADHYDQMQVVSEALTAHLLSAAKVTAARDDIMKKLKIPPNNLVPLEKLDSTLRKIERFEGKAEGVVQLVNEAKGVLTQGGSNGQ